MTVGNAPSSWRTGPRQLSSRTKQIEYQEWWLWASAVIITLLLTATVASFAFPAFRPQWDAFYWLHITQSVRGLAGLVLLFDIYAIYQQLQIQRIRRELNERDALFRVISENAADMIAVVGADGKLLYSSPAYERVLGYTRTEFESMSVFEQIHPHDRGAVTEAAEQAHRGETAQQTEYRIRHKDGTWRILESTTSVVRSNDGQDPKLVIVNRDITDRKRAEEKLRHSAFHDALTNLPNRALFLDRLGRAIARARRHPEYKFAILFVDVDDFKRFNDSLGHVLGDQLLVAIGRRLTSCLRSDDTVSRQSGVRSVDEGVARLGGDEFTVLLDDIRDAADATRVAERLQTAISAPFDIDGHEVFPTASVGIALSTTSQDGAEDLLRDADLAMFRAKAAGKARWEVFDTAMHASAVQRLTLETELRKAIEREEFRVYYQPIIHLQTAEICGFEALVRWNRPGRGIVSPGEFLSVADESGLIVPINRWVVQEASRQTRLWSSQFASRPPLLLSVNISGRQFARRDLCDEIKRALDVSNLDPACLQVEIMETVAMEDADRTGSILSQLKQLGIRLSIDDFGTGYSSLGRLRRFPVDSLKIDRSFISKMDVDTDNRAIVTTIVALAHSLGMKVVAEGTETVAEVREIEKLDCEYAQGYFFSRPVDYESMSQLLSAQAVGRPLHLSAARDETVPVLNE